jgi:hypothetical protein
MITFKSYQDLAYDAFFSCHVVGCNLESEKIYAIETRIIDVCKYHHQELTERDYK